MGFFCCLRPKRTINTSNLTREKQLEIIADRAEIPTELIRQDLNKIFNSKIRVEKADKILQELQTIKNSFNDALDKSVVETVIQSIHTYASPEFQHNITNDNHLPVIPMGEIKLLKEYYEPNVSITDMFTFELVEDEKREEPKSPGRNRAIH